MKKEDVITCASIVGANYSKKYQKSSTFELLDMFNKISIKPTYFVAEEKEELVGFAGFIQSWMDYNIYQIFWVNVLPEWQGKGIGKALVAKIITEIRKNKKAYLILLTADSDVKNNIYYKKHFGFKTLQKFDSDSWHLMSLLLEK